MRGPIRTSDPPCLIGAVDPAKKGRRSGDLLCVNGPCDSLWNTSDSEKLSLAACSVALDRICNSPPRQSTAGGRRDRRGRRDVMDE